jgi:ankyrin repeat protein
MPHGVSAGSLHLAAMNGRNGIAQLMLNAGTNPNALDWEGETAMLKFARQVYGGGGGGGQAGLIDMFVKKGADLDVRDKDGHSALYYSIDHNQVDSSKILIAGGADVSCKRALSPARLDLYMCACAKAHATCNLHTPHATCAYEC